jgi:hypothetical protein
MVMDVRINAAQRASIFNTKQAAMADQYPRVHGPYHFSWQPGNRICVGMDTDVRPKPHRFFVCTITDQFVVNLVAGAGAIAVGAGGVNAGTLTNIVTLALKQQFAALTRTAAFNNLGRSPQQVTFQNNEVVNRTDTKSVLIGTTMIAAGANHVFPAANTMNGFVVYQALGGGDFYYRNYDVRENVAARAGERIRVLHDDRLLSASLDATGSGGIRSVQI